MRQIDHYLATGVAAGEAARTHKVWNPSTGEVQAEVALGDAALLDLETHLLTIMDSPETNAQVLAAVGSKHMKVVMDYVNHFQTLHQVYDSSPRLHHIFDCMGSISTVGHCKDLMPSDGLVLHLDEAIPGDGELDIAVALKRWQEFYPDGYMLLEHLPNEMYPRASANTHDIAAAAGIDIH